MADVTATAWSGVSEPSHRLPLARAGVPAERVARWYRPPPAPLSVCIDAFDSLDSEACRLAAREARCRLVQAYLVAALLKRRLWRPLGFTRLPDYAAERLGLRARSLEEDARVVTALELLPQIRAAFENGAIRWTHARTVARIAT